MRFIMKKVQYMYQLIHRLTANSRSQPVRSSSHLSKRFDALYQHVRKGGGERAHARHRALNKLPVDRRISRLIDPSSQFLEFSPFAGLCMEYGDIPRAGVVTGIGLVSGRLCLIVANDSTVKAGTVYPITLKKQLRAQEIAQTCRLPVVYIVDSGGAFLPLQAEIFPDKNHGGRAFYNQAIMASEKIPQLAVVCGSCTAGGAYIPTMSGQAFIVERTGHIFLGGPPLVQAALGEKVSADELGGAKLHCSVSGCADYFAAYEEKAFESCRRSIAMMGVDNNLSQKPIGLIEKIFCKRTGSENHTSSDLELDKLCENHALGSSYNLDTVLNLIGDLPANETTAYHEFKVMYGQGLLTAWLSVDGLITGVIGATGSALSDADCLKAAHFIQLCEQHGQTLLFLHNFDAKYADQVISGCSLGAQAKLLTVLSSTTCPKISLLLSGSYGPSNWLLCGQSFSPNFLFSWPSADMHWRPAEADQLSDGSRSSSADSSSSTADLSPSSANSKNTDKLPLPIPEVLLKKMPKDFLELLRRFPALKHSSRCYDDGLLLPSNTRTVLSQCLLVLNSIDSRTLEQTSLKRRSHLGQGVIRINICQNNPLDYMSSIIHRTKLALALSIIKSKPDGVSTENHAREVCNSFKNKHRDILSRCRHLEAENLKLRQLLQLKLNDLNPETFVTSILTQAAPKNLAHSATQCEIESSNVVTSSSTVHDASSNRSETIFPTCTPSSDDDDETILTSSPLKHRLDDFDSQRTSISCSRNTVQLTVSSSQRSLDLLDPDRNTQFPLSLDLLTEMSEKSTSTVAASQNQESMNNIDIASTFFASQNHDQMNDINNGAITASYANSNAFGEPSRSGNSDFSPHTCTSFPDCDKEFAGTSKPEERNQTLMCDSLNYDKIHHKTTDDKGIAFTSAESQTDISAVRPLCEQEIPIAHLINNHLMINLSFLDCVLSAANIQHMLSDSPDRPQPNIALLNTIRDTVKDCFSVVLNLLLETRKSHLGSVTNLPWLYLTLWKQLANAICELSATKLFEVDARFDDVITDFFNEFLDLITAYQLDINLLQQVVSFAMHLCQNSHLRTKLLQCCLEHLTSICNNLNDMTRSSCEINATPETEIDDPNYFVFYMIHQIFAIELVIAEFTPETGSIQIQELMTYVKSVLHECVIDVFDTSPKYLAAIVEIQTIVDRLSSNG